MKVKQLTLKAFEFEVDGTESFTEYYTKNAPLIQGHLLIIKGDVNAEIKSFLDEKKVAYVNSNETSLLLRKKRSSAVLQEPSVQESSVSEETPTLSKSSSVYYRPIRSGEAIELEEDCVFLSRINSGAVISSSGSVQLFGIIDGIVRSDGEYLLLKEIGQGSVFFHGEELDKSQFDGQLKLVKYNNGIVIKEI